MHGWKVQRNTKHVIVFRSATDFQGTYMYPFQYTQFKMSCFNNIIKTYIPLSDSTYVASFNDYESASEYLLTRFMEYIENSKL